jgi:hypothetical protein
MKLLTSILALSIGCVAYAGPEQIIKQKAKDIRDQNNAAQGVPPRQPPPASAPAAQPVARPAATPQQTAQSRLQSDLNAIKSGTKVTDLQKENLARSLVGAVQGPNKLSLATGDKVAGSLAAALNEKLLTNALRGRLFQNLTALLAGHSMSPAQTTAVIEDVQKSFETAGVSAAAAGALASDLKLMSAELQKPAPK